MGELIQLSDGGIKVYCIVLYPSCHFEHLALVDLSFIHYINVYIPVMCQAWVNKTASPLKEFTV